MDKERRQFPRMECSGTASVQLDPSEPLCAARILDVSAGGCLVKFQRPQSIELDTRVELLFCVNNLPFRVRGIAKSIRSSTVVGFQFPQLRERIRYQLEDLVQELKESRVKRPRQPVIPWPIHLLRQ